MFDFVWFLCAPVALSAFTQKLLLLLAAHFLGDFAFQSTWMVMEKSKNWGVLFWHVCMYTASIVLMAILGHGVFLDWSGDVTGIGIAMVFVSHGFIDTFVKGRWGVTEKIWIDQLCHASVIILLVLCDLL